MTSPDGEIPESLLPLRFDLPAAARHPQRSAAVSVAVPQANLKYQPTGSNRRSAICGVHSGATAPATADTGKLILAAAAMLGAIYRPGYHYKKPAWMLLDLAPVPDV
jgi:hypothetical protein